MSGWCRVPRAWRPFKSSKTAFKSDFVAFNIMEKVRRFEDLEVFQKARELCKNVYSITNQEPFKSDYRFVQQIRAAAGSVGKKYHAL